MKTEGWVRQDSVNLLLSVPSELNNFFIEGEGIHVVIGLIKLYSLKSHMNEAINCG